MNDDQVDNLFWMFVNIILAVEIHVELHSSSS